MQIVYLVQSNHLEQGGSQTPTPYGAFVNSLSILALDLVQMVPMDCVVETHWTHYESLLLTSLTPIAIGLCIAVAGCVAPGDSPNRFGYFVSALLLILPSVSRRVCMTFLCHEYSTGNGNYVEYLAVDLSTSCTTATYELYSMFAWIMILICE